MFRFGANTLISGKNDQSLLKRTLLLKQQNNFSEPPVLFRKDYLSYSQRSLFAGFSLRPRTVDLLRVKCEQITVISFAACA